MKKGLLLFFTFSLTSICCICYCQKTNAGILYRSASSYILNSDEVHINIDLNAEKQTIHSFGASDCWTTKFIGKWADTKKKDHIADLLFSLDTSSDGSPRGIGLSLWRFNIGAGSFEQGDSSNIATDWRREECFLSKNGKYNWEKQAGQQWFLKAAKERGVLFTLGFSLSAPVFMTKNLRTYNSLGGTKMNIQEGKLKDYAKFLSNVTKHFQFDFLSPVNEPQWQWGKRNGASQEGTQATNNEISDFVKLLSAHLKNSASKIVIAEAGQIDYLTGGNNDGRGDQINQFFSPASRNYIGHTNNVAPVISAHSYFTTCPDSIIISKRKQVAEQVKKTDPSLQVWQTEFGILGNICNQYHGSPRNTGIDYGLYAAKVIHHDLADMNAAAWHWWLAVSPYDYSDALVYINAPSGKIDVNECKNNGIVLDSKQLWCFGNFSRFVRPGMKRVKIEMKRSLFNKPWPTSFMASAYKDPASKKIVIVAINMEDAEKKLTINMSNGNSLSGAILNAYSTSASDNLRKSAMPVNKIIIPGRSVVTLTGHYK